MKQNVDDAKQFASLFYHTYYRKDFSALLGMIDQDAVWSGFHKEKPSIGINEIADLLVYLKNEQREIKTSILEMQMVAVPLRQDMFLIDTTYWLKILLKDKEEAKTPFYSTMIIKMGEECKVIHVFFTVFGQEKLYSSEFLNSLQSMDIQEMRVTLLEHAKQMEEMDKDIKTLYNTVPGGIFKCLSDEDLTLQYMSDGFLDMVGYTKEEIRNQFQDSLRKLIVAEDVVSNTREVERQLKLSPIKVIQYRLIHKDGHYVTVLDKGQLVKDARGRLCFHCIVVDITREKQVEEELKLSLERYQIVMNQTNDVVFEWDVKADRLIVSDNWEKRYQARFWNDQQGLYEVLYDERCAFHPEDLGLLISCIEKIQGGKAYVEQELRVKDYRNVYVWVRIRMSAQFDEHHTLIKVIGIMIDIDREKRHSLSLRKKAEQDALTGLYNKMITQELIRNTLSEEPTSMRAFIIIDVDDFKKINDTMGHLYGDAVLNELSQTIRNTFHTGDIIGRIGGDEFIVLMQYYADDQIVVDKVRQMMACLQQMHVTSEKNIKISCSVGISMYPRDGNDFTTLYQNADYALYQAKMQGKNQFTFYNEEKMHTYLMKQKRPYASTISKQIDSDGGTGFLEDGFEKYVFEILYHTENTRNAMTSILEIIGMRFNVSRVYVFENSDDNTYCTNTFEWCNVGVASQIADLQHVTYEELGGQYMENFNEDRIFYCADIEHLPKEQYDILFPQGIKSMLQSAITDNGIFKGYVGFDECKQNRYWTKEQIDALIFIAEIISTFLLKRKAEEKIRLQNENLLMMLDNQSAFIYVVEPDTKKLLFLNKATKKVAPEACLGMCCYKAFMNRDQPCVGCPAATVDKEHPNNILEFYNESMQIWSDADAAYITWQHKDAILLSCHDITKFKRNRNEE